mgnify:CR=1 FL=1
MSSRACAGGAEGEKAGAKETVAKRGAGVAASRVAHEGVQRYPEAKMSKVGLSCCVERP